MLNHSSSVFAHSRRTEEMVPMIMELHFFIATPVDVTIISGHIGLLTTD